MDDRNEKISGVIGEREEEGRGGEGKVHREMGGGK